MSKEKILSIAIVVVVIGAIVGFSVYGLNKNKKVETPVVVTAAATVNGEDILQSDFDTQYATALASLKAQGSDATSTEAVATLKKQVLDGLISNKLVAQGIVSSGIKVAPEDVEKQYQAILTQAGGAEKLAEQLKTANLTEAQLRTNITNQLAIQSFLLKNVDISTATATEAEIKKFYDDNVKGQKNPPAYKDVKEQIKQQIINNKQQLLVNAFIESLKAKAIIKINTQ